MIAGIGRSWSDEILHAAKLSPFKRGNDLDPDEAARLREAIVERLGGAIDHYEQVVHAADPRQAAAAARRPPPSGRALPALRRPARGRLLRGLRDVLLPHLPDRGQAAQGPAAQSPVEVACAHDPRAGDLAPDFTLPDQTGTEVKLSALRGRPVVVYFYPKADTPGAAPPRPAGSATTPPTTSAPAPRCSASRRIRWRRSPSSPPSTR